MNDKLLQKKSFRNSYVLLFKNFHKTPEKIGKKLQKIVRKKHPEKYYILTQFLYKQRSLNETSVHFT